MNISDFLKIIMEIVYPQNLNCIFCDMPIDKKNKYSICKSCYEKLIIIKNSCPKCGKPSINLNLDEDLEIESCGFCKNKRFLFDKNISFIEYDEFSKKFVFGLKYSMKTYLSRIIADIMADIIQKNYKELIYDCDCITFVPLSEKREKERGFNQSEKIAKYLSKKLEKEVYKLILRKRDTKKLSKLDMRDRKKELRDAFVINENFNEKIADKSIILVDDIFTTGATVNEITYKLKLKGAKNVIVLTFLTGKYIKNVDN
ncbi:ComF family protein [Peptostreptococcus faecalis]|uniref:ComF family protein n=1 Tax=Peptostreptococcus faecalis TaxID=2045015 RepID=UPI001FA85DF3|nr:ComF family protein [Peptostreptococcus faecalis]